MTFHEKHQYFYEKYLRDEMLENERHDFEEKLSSDESFRRSFHHYKHHRKQYLTDLLQNDIIEAKKRWSLNSWLYLLISITGIALATNYYLFKDNEVQTTNQHKNKSWNIFNRIPFLSNRNDVQKAQPAFKHETEHNNNELTTDSIELSENDDLSESSTSIDNNGFANDIMELDSFVITYDKGYFDQRYKTIKSETDSIIVDSMMEILAAKSAGRNTQQSKPFMVYVEFWRSPINFRGYKFNGKKLVVYGILSPYEIYLLRNGDEYILRITHNDIDLIRDNNFHKF
jgi:hypothetical protein